MAFARPTLAELVDRIQTDLISRLSLVGAVLRRSFVYVLARVMAGAAHVLHGHLEFLGRQLFPDTSEGEFLDRHAGLFGITRAAPTYAYARVVPTGTATTVIPDQTVLVSAEGVRYRTQGAGTLPIPSGILIRAELPGAASSTTSGAVLSFASPIAGVDATATVSVSGLVDGTDAETDDALRERLLERLSAAPHGGTVDDYVMWAKSVPGVTRVWVTPWGVGPGTVLVRFVRDGDASIIPDAGEVAAVLDAITAQKPAHAAVSVAAPTAAPVNVHVDLSPDTAGTRAAVDAALAAFFRERSPGETIVLTQLMTAIGNSDGLEDFSMVSPTGNVTHLAHELPTLGTITHT